MIYLLRLLLIYRLALWNKPYCKTAWMFYFYDDYDDIELYPSSYLFLPYMRSFRVSNYLKNYNYLICPLRFYLFLRKSFFYDYWFFSVNVFTFIYDAFGILCMVLLWSYQHITSPDSYTGWSGRKSTFYISCILLTIELETYEHVWPIISKYCSRTFFIIMQIIFYHKFNILYSSLTKFFNFYFFKDLLSKRN